MAVNQKRLKRGAYQWMIFRKEPQRVGATERRQGEGERYVDGIPHEGAHTTLAYASRTEDLLRRAEVTAPGNRVCLRAA